MNRRGRPTPSIELNDHQRRALKRLSRARKEPANMVLRAKIILECASGRSNREVASRFGKSEQTVARWRRRFLEHGVDGLRDEPRKRRQRSSTGQDAVDFITKTLSPAPDGSGSRTAASVAAETGLSESTVRRRWRQNGIRPNRLAFERVNPDLGRYGIWSVAGVCRSAGQ